MIQTKRSGFVAAAITFLLLVGELPANAQTSTTAQPGANSTFFPFVIAWDDAAPGTATDMSYLNAKPAGVNGRIVARDGHFVEEKTGKRIRFLGTNFTFAENFPAHADAVKVAAHLAKLGINIVRIHHHDIDDGQLWDKKFKDHQHFDADAFDRLDYLIYQFKRNGIYVDINLHVSRRFTPEDGFPPSVDAIKTEFDKRVDNYDRRMIGLQKKFAHDYLTHVNPYTKLPYTSDPCVAMIEINNENSLVGNAATTLAAQLEDLPEPFRGELVGLWDAWLSKRYKDDSALRTAWRFGDDTQSGPGLVNASSKWTLEGNGLGATLAPVTDAATGSAYPASAPPVEIVGLKIDDQFWHIQTHITGLNLKSGAAYTVTFQAKADVARTISVYTGMDQADWHHVGLDSTVRLGTDWKTFTLPFEAHDTVPGHSRLTFVTGNQVGTVSLRDVSLVPGVSATLLTGGGTLAARTVDLPAAASNQERADWVHFLADTERSYADEMRDYVKHDLNSKANVIGSQMGYGESASLYREAKMDFADGHAYWEHPSFPGKPWDPVNWKIRNTPMVADLPTNGGTLLQLAEYRVAGKPFSVTEYNEPAPSDYQCETLPELASFAALQDWDAIFLFDWANYGAAAGEQNEKIQGFFAVGSNPAKAAFLPAAALIFRGEEIPPEKRTLPLNVFDRDTVTGVPMGKVWQQAYASAESRIIALRMSISFAPNSDFHNLPWITNPPNDSDGFATELQPMIFDKNHVVFASNAAAATAGYLGGAECRLGPARINVSQFGNNFCAITVTPIRNSYSLLLTIVGKVENTGMVWNSERTSVGNQWGSAPSQAEFVPARVTVPATAATRVWALDGTGRRTREIVAENSGDSLTFNTDPDAHTVWYEISR